MARKRRPSRLYEEVKKLLAVEERIVEQEEGKQTSVTDESTPLLGDNRSESVASTAGKDIVYERVDTKVTVERVVLRKHVTLLHAVTLGIGGVAGSGIFVSPTGVTARIGSVGASLIIWIVAGIFNLILSLCYAELGTALPRAGGDYAYIFELLGPLPAFLCLWTTYLLIGPCCAALMGRTVAAYMSNMFDLECSVVMAILIAAWITVGCTLLNSVSMKWSTRVLAIVSLAKLAALALIIASGIAKLAEGYTENFQDIFSGSNTDIGSIVGGFLPGFIAYIGWDAVNSLAEEMENPKRDLPLSLAISMIAVTVIYTLTNIAYFSVLSPAEFVASDAVASLFADKAIPNIAFIIPICVAMAASGGSIGIFMAFPRYAFAGARENQIPQVFSLVSIRHFTPIPAIALLGLASVLICAAVFLDIQNLLDLISSINIIRLTLSLIALLKLKRHRPDLPRTVKIPLPIVIISTLLLVAILIVAVIQNPLINGLGCVMFLLGLPIYYLGEFCKTNQTVCYFFDKLTMYSQMLMCLVPGGKTA